MDLSCFLREGKGPARDADSKFLLPAYAETAERESRTYYTSQVYLHRPLAPQLFLCTWAMCTLGAPHTHIHTSSGHVLGVALCG